MSRARLPEPAPLVSIVIPTRDRAQLLAACLQGVLKRTDYPALEVLIVDNDSREEGTKRLLESVTSDQRVRVLHYPEAFNWGAINNFAVDSAQGEIVLLLNNDIEVLEPGWLREIVSQALRPDVGVVGVTLLYPDGSIQHAGIKLGPNGDSSHIGRHLPGDETGLRDRLGMVRSVSAVTGACLALRRSVYHELGGVEADGLRVTWSDTDLCLKAWAKGYRVIVTPFARLMHVELATRGTDDHSEGKLRYSNERAWMKNRWGGRLDYDPFAGSETDLPLEYEPLDNDK